MSKIKIIFMSNSNFGLPTLNALHKDVRFEVLCVYTAAPKPANRGHKLTKNVIHEAAETIGIPVYTPSTIGSDEILHARSLRPDLMVVISYGIILPTEWLEVAKYKTLNLHPSSLPMFRGAAPIERTIAEGCTSIKNCVIVVTPRLDAGDIVMSNVHKISELDNASTMYEKLSQEGAELITQACLKVVTNTAEFVPQEDNTNLRPEVKYAKKIKKEELLLEKTQKRSVQAIYNTIRAFSTYGYCYLVFKDKRVKIIEAIISMDDSGNILAIKCTDGYVLPIMVKPEGKNIMTIKDFENGQGIERV